MFVKKVNILAIGAHPDDIEFGCGGTLIKYAEKGHKIYLLVMSNGEKGGGMEVRRAEQEKAMSLIGAKELFWGGMIDTRIDIRHETIEFIEAIIGKVKPDFIFCHYPVDTHQDHRHLAQMTISATRYIQNVLFYEGPTTERFDPHVYVDITRVLSRKVEVLLAHSSQVEKTNIENVSIVEIAHSCSNFRGIQGRTQYAEAFSAQRLFINI